MISSVLLVLLAVGPVDEAEAAYQGGRLKDAQATLEPLLYPLRIGDRQLEQRARFILGAAYFAEGDLGRAEEEVVRGWGAAPSGAVDPLVFPPDFQAFAFQVREQQKARIDALSLEHDRGEAANTPPSPAADDQVPVTASDAPIAFSPTDVPAERIAPEWAFVPFGVPQFKQRHPIRGTVLAAGQGACAATALTGLIGALALADGDGLYTRENARVARPLNTAWVVGAWCFIGLYGYGVVDAFVAR